MSIRGSSMFILLFPTISRSSPQYIVCRSRQGETRFRCSSRRKKPFLVALSNLFGVTDEAFTLLDAFLAHVRCFTSSYLKTPSFSPLLATTLLLASLSRPKEKRWKMQIRDLFARSSGNEQVLWQMVSLPYVCLRDDPRIQVLLLRACNSHSEQIKQLGYFSLLKVLSVSFRHP